MSELRGSGAEPLQDEDPRRIGGIPLVGRLGSGGMGRVYLGVHEGRYAAVKQVLSSVVAEDKAFLRRFGHELDNLARLPAEATAPLLASDRTAQPPWFATAYVPGLTLREAVELHGGSLPADALWLLLRDAASGLAAVHALDMVHRDIKPSNVMLTLDGLTVIDFGVAQAAEQSQLTLSGMVVGTPAYMSPEQASGARQVTGAVDVFALGSVLAYAACGRPPFGDESGHGVLYRIVHEEPDLDPVRELAPELADIVAACLDKDPDARPTAADLVELAEEHGPFTAPLWPEAITERLSERAAFAATVPEIDEPSAPVATLPAAEPEAKPEPESSPRREPRERRRRTRILFVAIPVVVVVTGTTLAIQLLPNTSAPQDGARSTPSATASASLTPTQSLSGTATSGKSPSSGKDKGKGEDKAEDKGTGGEQANTGTGTGTSAQDGSGGSDTSGGSDGSSGSGGSGGSGGTSTGDSGEDSTAGSYFHLVNGDNGNCLTLTAYGNGLVHGSCADNANSSWAFLSASDGSFKVVNQGSSQCLVTPVYGNNASVGSCEAYGQSSMFWTRGSGGTLRSAQSGQCLDLASGSSVTAYDCESGKASQRWTKE
ncbi:serine/threonine protein kinase [Streptomyces regalis]|uniref:non-specific serine/threonine protein kinase n=1 Tax=Streptomyces regalis TaxID=68262 RepID=A0A101JK69_9ACTN|nr:serine/threonine protein kinase [Streptomyces regalis]KUL28340.1 serine/threonine protein kinase [Streptomyces regalis]